MKFRMCKDGRHGACSAECVMPILDDDANPVYQETFHCECWCHVAPIPEPEAGEVMYGQSANDED